MRWFKPKKLEWIAGAPEQTSANQRPFICAACGARIVWLVNTDRSIEKVENKTHAPICTACVQKILQDMPANSRVTVTPETRAALNQHGIEDAEIDNILTRIKETHDILGG